MTDPDKLAQNGPSAWTDPSAPLPWTHRLALVLGKVEPSVKGVRVAEGTLVVDLFVPGAGGASVRMTRRQPGVPAYRSSRSHDFSYRADSESPAVLAAVDRLIAVLAHLENRLPDFASPRVPSTADPAPFLRRFPFTSLDEGLGEDGRVHRQLLIRLTGRCNQRCSFCSAPEVQDPSGETLRECLMEAPRTFPGCLLTLTGGEPTLRRDFPDLLALALSQDPIEGVQVQTNGVRLARSSGRALLPPHPRLTWFFSLHAVNAHLYDRITGTTGQLPDALEGLRLLVRGGHRVIVNVVVGSGNVDHLTEIVRSLPRLLPGLPLPEIHFSVLMCPPHRPEADRWIVPYEDLLPRLEEAAFLAEEMGIPYSPLVSSTHASIPPCFVSPEERRRMRQRPLVHPEETGYEDLERPWVKSRLCRNCPGDPHCLGVPMPYARRFGLKGLRPYGPAPGVSERVLGVSAATLPDLGDPSHRDFLGPRSVLVLDLLDPAQVSPPDRPVSLRELKEALPPEWRDRMGDEVRIRSQNRPFCLFPEAVLEPGALEARPARSSEGGAFGPDCAGCGLRKTCPGLSPAYLQAFGTSELRPYAPLPEARTWMDIARVLLTDRPEVRFPLHRLIPKEALPSIPCTRPWTRLELHDGGTYGPCCADYMDGRHFAPPDATPETLWRSDLLRRYRASMLRPGHPEGCRTTCPVLRSGIETPERLLLRGGPAEAVENQIACVRALLEGRLDLDYNPLSLCVPVTSFCNYDCLMCECGEKGTLKDQRPREFWESLGPFLAGGCELDVNGGEPLASPIFRSFLEDLARRPGPPSVALVTNGSLLTPRWLASLPRLPFRAVTVSLNAATPETYLQVNRGLPLEVVQRNLQALRDARREGRFSGGITYSFVLLKANLSEVVAFCRMGLRDKVPVRYLLPQRDRNLQSILTDPNAMRQGAQALREASELLREAGWTVYAEDARVQAEVLEERIAAGILEPIGNP